MPQSRISQLHIACLRQSCADLAQISAGLMSDQASAQRLITLASRLPGPSLKTEEHPRKWTIEEAIYLISTALASLRFLHEHGQASGLGQNLASGFCTTLAELETTLGHQLRQNTRSLVLGLYVIIDPRNVPEGRDPAQLAWETLEGGARILQLRDKLGEKGEGLALAQTIQKACLEKNALFIVNDHVDLATSVEAHGVHLGQGDLSISKARRILDPQQIVGRSNHSTEEARVSECLGADYIAVGAMFPTTAKDQPLVGGLDLLRQVKAVARVPVVAIGGITQKEVKQVVRAGADAVCVISAVGSAPDPREATLRMVDTIQNAGGKV